MVWLRYWVRCGWFFIFRLVHLVGLNFWSLNLHLTLYPILWEDKVQFEPELIAGVVILCMLFFGVPFLVAPCIHAKHDRHVLNSCIQQNKVLFSSMIGDALSLPCGGFLGCVNGVDTRYSPPITQTYERRRNKKTVQLMALWMETTIYWA